MTAPAGLASALPQYSVGAKIGSGGMGVVYEGVHRSLGRHVAIKQLPADLIGDPDVNARFDREARVLASLDHPHIVPVYDYVQTGRDNLLVMEKLDGGTVYSKFHDEGLTGEQSCAIALAMLAGLHAAHAAGVLHLDVKPKNLLFTSAGVMKVADFGIAQVVSEGATMVTHAGEVLGTPAYIAPEQAMGNPLSPAADVYAAGTVLYELLCGELPYDRTRGAVSMMRQRIFNDPQPLPRVPEPLSTVVMRSLARDPIHRYRDAEAFAVDLSAAATAVFGPGWLERSRVPVHLGPRVMGSITQQLHRQPDAATIITPPVRGTVHEPTRSIDFAEARGRGLRPASELMRQGPSPLWPGLAAAVLVIVLAVLPFMAPETLEHKADGQGLAIDGQPVSGPVALNLSEPLTITGKTTPGTTEIVLEANAAGIPMGGRKLPKVVPNADGTFQATMTPDPLMRWTVGGAATGEIKVGDGPVQRFTVVSEQHPMASVMGSGSLLLGLFGLAYIESTMRTLRRGHRRPAAPFTALPLGALVGAAVWLLVSVLTTREPSLTYGIASAVVGALAASSLVLATAWSARKRSA
ncbi:serine/threonine protein kinase [Actinokineospora alba]|uniref:non-specific serine/threonine protein kinase n=1 Tax=Actinokineospora alba TaxID=504798 RepID=A0A1H0SXE4_9PSEU|nr:serine/threonine-protein kinase [Actinokineospora alba]TDP66492.1 serine/threonine-protein kinase [Actinokineospora alba]SDJ36253.1 serine/threonine protein kinase [Actinokineospora alba]SDP46295.1 serine/threonine protein kinase [Actinokineospora alba]